MTRDFEVLGPEASVAQAAEVMQAAGVGLVPIVRDGRPIGVLTARDVVARVVAARRDPAATKVSEVMTVDPVVCRVGEDLAAAASLMARRRVRRLLVIRPDGRLGGVLSAEQTAGRGRLEAGDASGNGGGAPARLRSDEYALAVEREGDEETMSEAGRREIKDPSIEARPAETPARAHRATAPRAGDARGTAREENGRAAAPRAGDAHGTAREENSRATAPRAGDARRTAREENGRAAAAGEESKGTRNSSSCPNCGMERDEWSAPEGYPKEGLTYCCEGCAEDRGCVCFHAATGRRPAAEHGTVGDEGGAGENRGRGPVED